MLKTLFIAAALSLSLSATALAEKPHPTANEFSRLTVAGMKHGLSKSHPAMAACVGKISDSALSEAYQAVIARIVPAADIATLDAFFGTPLGKRWTDDNILFGQTGGASHGEFSKDELKQITPIVSLPSYIKLQEVGASGDPVIQKAVMKALDPCQ
ncbi:hypothetical protein [Lysobacter sp. cf310]|uniref:hypothetical protein n=1 Tax=Lysobacter sp. cf310 TaxID=1761790 RepID=UPI0008E92BF6|nr:hypothetical protein [Lysobacter sp. cf310]SFK34779.1 hypothetical protein SAMN04487938_0411 [Lysobacter sp. cf310]